MLSCLSVLVSLHILYKVNFSFHKGKKKLFAKISFSFNFDYDFRGNSVGTLQNIRTAYKYVQCKFNGSFEHRVLINVRYLNY